MGDTRVVSAMIREISGMPRTEKAELLVSTFADFLAAVERAGITLVPTAKPSPATFLGVPIICDVRVPDGFVMIKKGSEIVNILDLRALADRKEGDA